MKNCPNCGKQIDDDAMFCNYCGVSTTPPAPEQKKGIPRWVQIVFIVFVVLGVISQINLSGNSGGNTPSSTKSGSGKAITLNLPQLPQEIKDYQKNSGWYLYKLNVNSIEYESKGDILTLRLKVAMESNSNGNNSNDVSYVGYKLTQTDGTVIDSGIISVSAMAVGDTVQEEKMIFGKCKAGQTYTLELTNVTGVE